jgi:prefoldin subunit 5
LANVNKEEEELRRLSVEMRFLEQTAETLQQRISMVNAAMTDLSYANVSIEKTLPEAKVLIKERLEELEKSMRSAQQQFSQIAERINVGRNRLETLLASVREGTS